MIEPDDLSAVRGCRNGFWLAVVILALAVSLLLITGCTNGPLEDARAWAWDAHEYRLNPGDWRATPDGDCKNKALAIGSRLAAQGYSVSYMTGCRTDEPGCRFHIVPVVDGQVVIDSDGVHPIESYPWTPILYDIEAAVRSSGGLS